MKWFRDWSIQECLDHIRADDDFTHGISIGPVREPPICVHCHMHTVHHEYSYESLQ